MVYAVNRASAAALKVLAEKPRMAAVSVDYSAGWHESSARSKGFFETEWGPAESWWDVILQGPHVHAAVSFYKSPNPTLRHNQDWSPVDLETLATAATPVTAYKPRGSKAVYDASYTHWGRDRSIAARGCYRVAWRVMTDNVAERTLVPAIIPVGAAHVDGLFSAGFAIPRPRQLAIVEGFAASLVSDFLIRVVPKSTIRQGSFERLAIADMNHPLIPRSFCVPCD
jgi:hypothetical protein